MCKIWGAEVCWDEMIHDRFNDYSQGYELSMFIFILQFEFVVYYWQSLLQPISGNIARIAKLPYIMSEL